ncbi:hypothetical protein [Haloarcula marismortui]|uniref:PglZ domain-containing protein n=1 Tax=Haloarcula marismortui ATCC 33800 TaxID=662476 RepID=M0JHZ9_9EURY|nr:hypothetical protein [Haloarcula sinaiiensis]EMA08752.1 hypothetical protein C436_20343 [Haloarcula sinaiiensis ATCC 33800]QUJ74050.1 hypothetical protein KDQ40_18990 [Haloarcula sinaiiensis ATCC 33800]
MDLDIVRANLRNHWNDLDWWRDIAMPFAVRATLVQPYFRYVHGNNGIDVFEEDWDNLLILDACRYDMFAAHNTLKGDLQQRVSKGSNTAEFLQRNFGGKTFDDTVYVTANPQVDVRLDEPFYETVSVWRDHWDEDFNTVRPEAMAEAILDTQERFPNKRIIAHFVQPHYPFIGEFGRALVDDQAGIELSKRQATGETAESDHYNIWDLLQRGVVSEADVWKGYTENLRLALERVETLLDDLFGRTVVTSDHGNLVGERPTPCPVPFRMYGHPPSVYADALVTVPWLVVESETRPDIVEGVAAGEREGETANEDDAEDQLRALGYL